MGHLLGEPRSKLQVLDCIREIASQPSESKKKDKRKCYGLKENPNPLLSLSTDFYKLVCGICINYI